MEAVLSRTSMPLGLTSKARIGKGFAHACSPARVPIRRNIARSAVAFKEDEERVNSCSNALPSRQRQATCIESAPHACSGGKSCPLASKAICVMRELLFGPAC
jgi:hypothetical protein